MMLLVMLTRLTHTHTHTYTFNCLPLRSFASRHPEAFEAVYNVLPEFEDNGVDDALLFVEVSLNLRTMVWMMRCCL